MKSLTALGIQIALEEDFVIQPWIHRSARIVLLAGWDLLVMTLVFMVDKFLWTVVTVFVTMAGLVLVVIANALNMGR